MYLPFNGLRKAWPFISPNLNSLGFFEPSLVEVGPMDDSGHEDDDSAKGLQQQLQR